MDFTLDENQQAVADLAEQIFADRIDPSALRATEKAGQWFDKDTYLEIAKAGLVGIAVSEDLGGGGLGLVELGQVLEAQGRHVAPVPVFDSALVAIAIDKFGDKDLRKAEVPAIIAGDSIMAIGIQEWHSDDYLSPAAEAAPDGDGHKITGTKIMVEFAAQASKLLVSARDNDGEAGLYLVDLSDSGISMNAGVSTRYQPVHEIIMTAVPAVKLAAANVSALEWFANSATALLCAVQIGLSSQALKMAAEYTSEREQFGRKIATFQAVTHSLANQYINVNAIKLSCYAALWTLDNIGDDAEITADFASWRVSEAKWFSSHIAMEVVNSTQHVHGGIGMDRDYPLHRYTIWNKHIQTSLGAGMQHLRRLGAQLAAR